MCTGCGWRCESIYQVRVLSSKLDEALEKADRVAAALDQEMHFCDMGCEAKCVLREWKEFRNNPERSK